MLFPVSQQSMAAELSLIWINCSRNKDGFIIHCYVVIVLSREDVLNLWCRGGGDNPVGMAVDASLVVDIGCRFKPH